MALFLRTILRKTSRFPPSFSPWTTTTKPARTSSIRAEIIQLLAGGTIGYIGVCQDDSNCVLKWHRPTEQYNPKHTGCIREMEIEKIIYACPARILITALRYLYEERQKASISNATTMETSQTISRKSQWSPSRQDCNGLYR